MNNTLKIFVGIVILLGIVSGGFLLFVKNKKAATPATPKTIQASATVKSLTPLPSQQNEKVAIPKKKSAATTNDTQAGTATPKTSAVSQWNECRAKTFPTTSEFLWSIQVIEAIPASGTYAKGNLNGDVKMPVHVIIKSDSKIVDKIKAMLIVGKRSLIRGNCTDVASDGSVLVQAF